MFRMAGLSFKLLISISLRMHNSPEFSVLARRGKASHGPADSQNMDGVFKIEGGHGFGSFHLKANFRAGMERVLGARSYFSLKIRLRGACDREGRTKMLLQPFEGASEQTKIYKIGIAFIE